jgi:hypothetical protein
MEGIDMDTLSMHDEMETNVGNDHAERIKANKRQWNTLKSNIYSQHDGIQTFYTQVEALQYSARSSDLRVFGEEYLENNPGKRKFLVATVRQFYNKVYILFLKQVLFAV